MYIELVYMKAKQLIMITASLCLWVACKKDQPAPPTLPEVTTSPVTVSGGIATGGGELIDDGNSPITAIGVAWSSTNTTPTVADDTTKNTISGVTFTATVDGLTPSTTYYFRAYATNAVGTSYGDVLTVNSGNGGPEARNTGIEGQANITNKIKATFTYFDHEGDAQAPGTYQWYVAGDSTSGSGTAISGATDSTYVMVAADQGKFIRAAITAKASAGTTTGVVAYTPWLGPIGGEPTTVTFMYNGEEVTYGIVSSPNTGKKWLDRNIGAKQVATSPTDYLSYGDLFQWGRPADGHQLFNWTSATEGVPVNGITETRFTSDVPNSNLFVVPAAFPWDWRDSRTERWALNPQGPCPLGWHVPSEQEWRDDMGVNSVDGAERVLKLQFLKLTTSGGRYFCCEGILSGNSDTHYWASSIKDIADGYQAGTINYSYSAGDYVDARINSFPVNAGNPVRCIRD